MCFNDDILKCMSILFRHKQIKDGKVLLFSDNNCVCVGTLNVNEEKERKEENMKMIILSDVA